MDKRATVFKVALAKNKMTQYDLAEKLGISQGTVNGFIKTLKAGGKPQAATAQKYADALGIPVEKLL